MMIELIDIELERLGFTYNIDNFFNNHNRKEIPKRIQAGRCLIFSRYVIELALM